MLTRLFFALVLIAPSVIAAPMLAVDLHTLRTEAFSVCSNVLVYYNPQQDGGDPKNLQRYQQALAHLQALVATSQDSHLISAVSDLRDKVVALEHQPASDAHLYPSWINPLLQAQARLDVIAEAAYREKAPADDVLLDLDRQSIDLEILLLLYESRVFGSLAVYLAGANDNSMAELDRAIDQRFEDLSQRWPQQTDVLTGLKRKYAFIRPRLVQQNTQWVAGGAAYYLEDAVDRLSRLAVLRAPGLEKLTSMFRQRIQHHRKVRARDGAL